MMSRYAGSFLKVLVVLTVAGVTACRSDVPSPRAEVKTPPPVTAQTLPSAPPPVIAPVTPPKPVGPQLLVGPMAPKDSLKVALLVPLTGPQADAGQGLANAAEMAVSEMASDRLTLLPIDTAAPGGAKAATAEALEKGSSLILGPLFASDVAVAAPLAHTAGVQMISYSSDIGVAGPGVNVVGFLPREQAKRIARYAVAHGLHSFAALAPDTAFGHQMVDALNLTLSESRDPANGTVPTLGRVVYYPDEIAALPDLISRLTDYPARQRAYAIVTGGNPSIPTAQAVGEVPFQALLIPETGTRLHQIVTLLQQQSVDLTRLKLLGSLLWADPLVQSDPLMAGAWYAAPSPESVAAFEGRYQKLFGVKPPAIAELGYDTAALAAVLARRPGDHPFSRETLGTPSGFAGTAGLFRFLPDNTVERGFAVMEIKPPGAVIVDPALDHFSLPVAVPVAQPSPQPASQPSVPTN